jgi:hypothetical protein
MKRLAKLAAVAVLLAPLAVHARDDRKMFPVAAALASPVVKERLDPTVKLYFAGQPHPGVASVLGNWGTNKKTNAVGKSDQEACEWAFLSAMLALQKRARQEGGDAVVDIQSEYKGQITRSAKEYMCGTGSVMVGVAFRGKVVRLAK